MDMHVETKAHFRTVSYKSLLAGDPSALSTLLSAALEEGFFYLDLTDVPYVSILPDVYDLLSTSKNLFDASTDEKMQYDTNKLGNIKNYGYKPVGRNTGVIEGRRDGHELFLVPRDNLLGLADSSPLNIPPVLLRSTDTLKRFQKESHQICHHRPDQSSTSIVALIKYPRQDDEEKGAGHIAHTNVGSLTLLFCEQEGLQAMHPSSGQWESVTPRAGHAVVNIGDSLHHMSGRRFKSALHRVLPYTQKEQDSRYSVIYFMCPELSATFTDENEKEWTSIDWHTRKFDAFRAESASDVQQILDGRV